jgi:hypothetical protein
MRRCAVVVPGGYAVSKKLVAAVLKAPDDPAEKKAWVASLVRLQVAMWVDGTACCAHCKRPYASVDDFLERNPRAGPGIGGSGYPEDDRFIDDACWPAYEAAK